MQYILLEENNKLFDALIFNPVRAKEKTDFAAAQAVAASVFCNLRDIPCGTLGTTTAGF